MILFFEPNTHDWSGIIFGAIDALLGGLITLAKIREVSFTLNMRAITLSILLIAASFAFAAVATTAQTPTPTPTPIPVENRFATWGFSVELPEATAVVQKLDEGEVERRLFSWQKDSNTFILQVTRFKQPIFDDPEIRARNLRSNKEALLAGPSVKLLAETPGKLGKFLGARISAADDTTNTFAMVLMAGNLSYTIAGVGLQKPAAMSSNFRCAQLVSHRRRRPNRRVRRDQTLTSSRSVLQNPRNRGTAARF